MKLISIKQAYSKTFKTLDLDDDWISIFGEVEKTGRWTIYGREKHGKTITMFMLAKMLSTHGKIACVLAEEGISKNVIDTMKRTGIDDRNRQIGVTGYESWEELEKRIAKRQSAWCWIIDNITVYKDEASKKQLLEMARKFENDKLIIFLAHEERKEPEGAIARLWKKLSQIIIRVEGLVAEVSGRCPGGQIIINEEKANIYWGTEKTMTK